MKSSFLLILPHDPELLKLKYGKEIQFVASTDKGAFGAFEVSPKQLHRFTGEIGVVPVVAVGDALISAEYRYGTGIKNGVAEAYMLTRALSQIFKKAQNEVILDEIMQRVHKIAQK